MGKCKWITPPIPGGPSGVFDSPPYPNPPCRGISHSREAIIPLMYINIYANYASLLPEPSTGLEAWQGLAIPI